MFDGSWARALSRKRRPRPQGRRGERRQRVSSTGGAVWVSACAALLLTGCAHDRFVTVPCITKEQALPAEPPKVSDKLTGRADEDIKTIAGSNVRLRAWGQGLRGILEGCRG